ncbi:3-keto-steroid reductase/17-beta-hydroxysteroid dehydrogenase 7-like isoform X2 [Gigantopelta aegis]|uniref:3-keto-steroid reductase/17-beta-hydroxysteroid dehydrogenase 7-like isoform X2 n=1 Tax=Gigantopelta aegis TaxID=1735272 RepID=UPI001B88A2E9|nr:3-keto-steroid reductase/17-beta-hydroxysteroid dehydrogenase 7-like isoform X2 [Gigantopelta aegis]
MREGKVAVVTGGNAGLGLTLCKRLLSEHKNLYLCLACRNQIKAEEAKKTLEASHPSAVISIVILDTSSVQSVYEAAQNIKRQFHHVDFLYLNAGMMPVSGVNWDTFCKGLFSRNCIFMLSTGTGLLKCLDDTTPEGLKQINELDSCLGGPDRPTQIIWTSSSAAARDNFDIEDIQHTNGEEPYKSSKYAIDMLSVELNTRLNKKNIYSHSVCPGLVMTNLTWGILPAWFWKIMFPFICLMRFIVPSLTYSAYSGCEALVWLISQRPECLDPLSKFYSQCSVCGTPSVKAKQMSIDVDEASELYNQLSDLNMTFHEKYKDKHKILRS